MIEMVSCAGRIGGGAAEGQMEEWNGANDDGMEEWNGMAVE